MTPRRLDRSAHAWALLLAMSGCALDDGAEDPDSLDVATEAATAFGVTAGGGSSAPASAMMPSSSQTDTNPSH